MLLNIFAILATVPEGGAVCLINQSFNPSGFEPLVNEPQPLNIEAKLYTFDTFQAVSTKSG